MWSKIVGAVGSILAVIFSSLLSTWQARADQKQLGADEAERATDAQIDAMEAKQDEVDSVDRGGAAGVLNRLRRNGDGTAARTDG